MLFIGFAIAIVAGLVLLISTDAGSLIGLTQNDAARFLPLVILLIVFAAGLFARRYRLGQIVSSLMLWGVMFTVAIVGYTYRDDLTGIAARVFGELMPGTPVIDHDGGTVQFRGGIDGHYQISAKVNGATILTIFDTGASAVVLTAQDARKAGIDTAYLRYDTPVSTANGTGRAARVVLDKVDVGGIVRTKVRAFVAESGALDQSLLGMSFIGSLSRYSASANSLELVD